MFDSDIDEYDNWFVTNNLLFKNELEAIKSVLPKDYCDGIEIGLGTGMFASALGIKKGIEPSLAMAKKARERGIDVDISTAEAIPLKNKSSPLALMITVDCFLDDVLKAFNEIHRILEHEGLFVIGFLDKNTELGQQYELKKQTDKFYKEANFHSAQEIISYLEKANFEIEKIMQTIFSLENKPQEIKDGFGSGLFVAIKAKALSKHDNRKMHKKLEIGQQIESKIVAINKETIFIDLNSKSEGTINSVELKDADGKLSVKEGDTIKAFFIGYENGEMHFTTKIAGDKIDQTLLENAYRNNIPVEGKVKKEIKGGYEVEIGQARAFCPYSQMGFKQKDTSEIYVGKTLSFLIQEYKENGRNILVSNKVICEAEYQNQVDDLAQNLKEGMIIKGTVSSVQEYGAFVDIGGFQALLPVSELSLSHITDIHQHIKTGQEIEAAIIKMDWPKKRVSLSMKALLADPWSFVAEKYPVESKHQGTICRIADFGIFVTLEPGLDGLIHVSEMDTSKRNSNLHKLFKVGASVAVEIKNVDTEQKRLSLKFSSSNEQDIDVKKYLLNQDESDSETYNPFANLANMKSKKI